MYAFKTVGRIIFETPRGKLQNLLVMKLTADVTLIFLSGVNNDIYFFLFYVTDVDFKINSIHQQCMLLRIGIECTL